MEVNNSVMGMRKWISFESYMLILMITFLMSDKLSGDAFVYGMIAGAGIFFAANTLTNIKR